MLVDSHCHLDYLERDINQVILDANNAGVKHLLTVGTNFNNADVILQLCAKYTNVDCSIGIHPLELDNAQNVNLDWLITNAKKEHVIALGETGLDYHYQQNNAKKQQQLFELHLEACKLSELPIIVHTRKAKADTLRLLHKFKLVSAGVLHCFTEDWDMAKTALDLGFYISFSGIVTFKNVQDLQNIACKVPLDRILVETDSPYLAPVPYRGKSNLPQYVVEVTKFIANLRNMDYVEFAHQTTSNFKKLFSKTRLQ